MIRGQAGPVQEVVREVLALVDHVEERVRVPEAARKAMQDALTKMQGTSASGLQGRTDQPRILHGSAMLWMQDFYFSRITYSRTPEG